MDCYKEHNSKSPKAKSATHFIDYCLFISFFPQLIAGPIVHHKEMIPQFQIKTRYINWEHKAKGLFIFFIGLFKKAFIADEFAQWANAGFSAVEDGKVLNIFESWATSLSYSFELYFDFSGYCDMAIGLGLLFNILLPLNFNSPYKALNIADFWRKWHITLGRFLKNYIYIPLGGNKNPTYINQKSYETLNKLFTLRNLFIVAFLSGIWHGAGWGFIIWGSLHGLALICHKIYEFYFKNKILSLSQNKLYQILCWFLTFNFINISWIFFRAENLQGAFNLIKGMFGKELILPFILETKLGFLTPYGVSFNKWALAITESMYIVFLALLFAFIICLFCKNSMEIIEKLKANWKNLIFLFAISISGLLQLDKAMQFLYFNF